MCVYIYNEFAFLFTFFIFSWLSFVPVLIKYWSFILFFFCIGRVQSCYKMLHNPLEKGTNKKNKRNGDLGSKKFGVSYILQEMLTYKYDHNIAR